MRGREIIVRFKGVHFVKDIILTCVRWYVAYPLSYRQVEELMQERGVSVNHATINRWVLKYSPQLEASLPSPQAPGEDELADGRDVYQSQRPVAVSLPRRG